MNSRERVYRAVLFDNPDRVPRDLWAVPAVSMFRSDELNRVVERFPPDIVVPTLTSGTALSTSGMFGDIEADNKHLLFAYGSNERIAGTPFAIGSYTDEWGCEWQVGEVGVVGEVKRPPLADWSLLDKYRPPWEVLEDANWEVVNQICSQTNKFVLTPWHINPFERMQFLRGTEALFIDLVHRREEVIRLRNMINEFFLAEVELWCGTNVDAIRISDDWGTQKGMLISPKIWRELFKPMYAEYCQMIHAAGKFAFMHSDGHIRDIIPDLIQIGIDAINLQLFCMDIEELGQKFKGQITFWGELDRQWILPFGTSSDVREGVMRVRKAFNDGTGGIIAQLEWGKYDPIENVIAAYETWSE